MPVSWSPDGKRLAFIQESPSGSFDIWILPLEQDRRPQPWRETPFNERNAEFSPDGRWLAYTSNESGRFEVYVEPYPGPGARYQVSTDGGDDPAWARSGRELFYLVPQSEERMSAPRKLMVVDVRTEPTFIASKPRLLFEGPLWRGRGPSRHYDVSPDGRRFLIVQEREQPMLPRPANLQLVVNWIEELKRRVPGK